MLEKPARLSDRLSRVRPMPSPGSAPSDAVSPVGDPGLHRDGGARRRART
jgi:hypothetical protein